MLLLLAASAFIAADNFANMTPKQVSDYERLTGTFILATGVVHCKEVAEDVRKRTILVTDHDKFTVSTGDEAGTSARGTFNINPTKTPKTADSLQQSGAEKGKTMLGIYEIIDHNPKRACWDLLADPARLRSLLSLAAVTSSRCGSEQNDLLLGHECVQCRTAAGVSLGQIALRLVRVK